MANDLTRFEPKDVINGLAHKDETILAAVKENPGTALSIIAGYDSGDAKKNTRFLPVLARATDEVLGMIADPAEARDVLNQNLTPDAQAELTAVHGDRLSVIIQIADPQVVVKALGKDSYDSREAIDVCFMLMAWADNLKTRPDWSELLEMEVAGRTLRDLLIAGLFYVTDGNSDGDITMDMWERVGLNVEEDIARMHDLIKEETMPLFSPDEIADARTRLREQRQAFEVASKSAAKGDVDI